MEKVSEICSCLVPPGSALKVASVESAAPVSSVRASTRSSEVLALADVPNAPSVDEISISPNGGDGSGKRRRLVPAVVGRR